MTALVRRVGRGLLWLAGGALMLALLCTFYIMARWDAPERRPAPILAAPRDSATIARGEHLFKHQARCWSCHAAGHADATSAPSGGFTFDLSATGPGFGIWRSRNITPDAETGIGGWTDGEIVQAIREGVRKDRTVMFPIMPNDWYRGMADDDALALVAYLRSIPPVSNAIPPQEPSFVAKALFTFGVLKPQAAVTAPVLAPPRGVTPAYGEYVASRLAGCLECHTPRNLSNGEFYLDSLGAGSSFAFGDAEGAPMRSFARNITPDKETGIGAWTEEQFLAALTVGMRPDGTVLDPQMPYAHLKSCPPEDLAAIYRYIQTLSPLRRTTPPARFAAAFDTARGETRGSYIFRGRCQACHGFEGSGAQPTSVTLSEVVPSMSDDDLREMIRAGDTGLKMPSFGATIPPAELDDLVAYLRSWERR